MHLPLFINSDKQDRSYRLLTTAGVLFFFACTVFSQLWNYSQGQTLLYECSLWERPQKPTNNVTVTTWTWFISNRRHAQRHTYEKPLIELYDELCEIKTRVESANSWSCLPSSDEEKEQALFEAEKEFKWNYTLTMEQVAMIKREGDRLKAAEWEHEMRIR